MVMGETMTNNNDKEILDLITASVEAMGMNPNHATIKVEHSVSDIPSELELRLRKEIIANLNQIYALLPERNADNTINCIYLTLKATDMLKVLWGEK
jgi:hypothetical protein